MTRATRHFVGRRLAPKASPHDPERHTLAPAHGRNGSHFTRVARIVAYDLAVLVELDLVHDILSVNVEDHAGHKLPTLHVGDFPLFGTDNTCRKLADITGRAGDPRVVLSHQVTSDLLLG